MKKAYLRSWDLRTSTYEDTIISVGDEYDFAFGPYDPRNENLCPVVGSNQEIICSILPILNPEVFITNKTSIWVYFDYIKQMAVDLKFEPEEILTLKEELDDLFHQATGSKTCPAWYIGGFG